MTLHHNGAIAPLTLMNEAQLVHTIKTLITKGDKARDKADQFFIAAGQHLKTLKTQHDASGGTWAGWEHLVKEKCGIGKSRASELMQLTDGRKTVEGIRAEKAQSMKRVRASSPPRGGESRALTVADQPAPDVEDDD